VKLPGFIGPSYTTPAKVFDSQRTVNYYPELSESGTSRNVAMFVRTPGLAQLVATNGSAGRGMFTDMRSGRTFALAGNQLYEITYAAGVWAATLRGSVSGTQTASWASNGLQIAIATVDAPLTVFDLSTNVVSVPANAPVASTAAFVDQYIVVSVSGTAKIQWSDLVDATSWNGLDFATAEAEPDNVVGLIADHRELWIGGQQVMEVFRNTSDPSYVFGRVQSGLIQQGLMARKSLVSLANGVAWIGGDQRGGPVAWVAEGYAPRRVSTHAVEAAWSKYARIDDAESFEYVEDGHAFWVISFPTANATWVYDANTGQWHERGWWEVTPGQYRAVRGRFHTYAFGRHLVQDWETGVIYEMSKTYLDDNGSVIRRLRSSPHIADPERNVNVAYSKFELIASVGIGLSGAEDPVAFLRISNDGGNTWSNEIPCSAGPQGDYQRRMVWWRLGAARDRVFEVSMTDAVEWALVDALIDFKPGAD